LEFTGNAFRVANDGLAIYQAGANWQRFDRHFDERKAVREVVSVACNQLHAGTVRSALFREQINRV
jgi:hypothetical protein